MTLSQNLSDDAEQRHVARQVARLEADRRARADAWASLARTQASLADQLRPVMEKAADKGDRDEYRNLKAEIARLEKEARWHLNRGALLHPRREA